MEKIIYETIEKEMEELKSRMKNVMILSIILDTFFSNKFQAASFSDS